ncbi:MAG: hypothetical protein ACPGU1_11110 [Myxococcota bacterium]
MSAPQPTSSSERRVPVVTMIVVLALIGLGIGYALFGAPSDVTSNAPREALTRVVPGELYYVFVETVEFTPRGEEDNAWDLDESAPDIAYEIQWKGQTVFESTELSDALIGRWSGMKLGIDQALSLLKRGKTDPAQIIDAALMRAESGGRFTLLFEDSDLTGSDPAGEIAVAWDDLTVGSHVLKRSKAGHGVITATIRTVPSSGDLFKVVRSLSRETP